MGLAKGVITLVALLGMVASATGGTSEINRISFTTSEDGEGQIIRFHASSPLEAGDLEVHHEALNTATVVINGARLSAALVRDRAVDPVRSYRLTEGDNVVRIELEFDGYRPVRVIAYTDRDSNDALVSVHYANIRSQSGIGRGPTFVGLNPGTEDEGHRWSLDCVVVDAGHGGEDLGAVANGLQEKDINLQVAKILGERIEDKLGIRVVYTRKSDRFVPLEERGRIANEKCGKLFVSLHVNSAPSRVAEGTEIFFLGLHKTEAARTVMERENAVIRFESDQEQYAAFGDDAFILQTMAQSTYLRESETLAGFVDAHFRESAKRTGRGVKQAGFLVLWKASMPAILVELGFITNRKEAAYLQNPSGQNDLAEAIYRAIVAYRDFYERGIVPKVAD